MKQVQLFQLITDFAFRETALEIAASQKSGIGPDERAKNEYVRQREQGDSCFGAVPTSTLSLQTEPPDYERHDRDCGDEPARNAPSRTAVRKQSRETNLRTCAKNPRAGQEEAERRVNRHLGVRQEGLPAI